MRLTIDEAIAKAIDEEKPQLAIRIADKLRAQGCNYDDVVKRVQAVRLNVSVADWDALLYEGESSEE